jgi:hypothetical protein
MDSIPVPEERTDNSPRSQVDCVRMSLFCVMGFHFSKLGKYVRTFFPWEVTQQRHDISSIPGIS